MDAYVTIGTELDTKSFDKQIKKLEFELESLEEEFELAKKWDLSESDLIDYQNQIEKTKNKIIQLRKEQNKVNTQGFKNLGKSLTDVTKRISKMALAVFGIRSAFMFVRNAINTIAGDDDQLRADIDYMKAALAYTLEPVVRSIVSLVKEIMVAIQNIIYALTKKNIFENANKSLKGASKSAKELRKTMASFDEMNVLNDTSGGGGGTTTPSFNLGEINEMSSKGRGLLGIITAIAGAIGAMKLSSLLKTLGLITTQLTIMQGLGIFGLILSIYNVVSDLVDIWNKFDASVEGNNTTMKDWGNVIKWVGIGVASLGLIIGAFPVVVAGAIIAIVALIMKYWDEIKAFFTDKVFAWMDKQIEKLEKTTIGSFFAQMLRDSKAMIGEVLNVFDGLFKGIKQVFDGITGVLKGDSNGWKNIFKGVVNFFITTLNGFVAGINTLMTPFRALMVAFGKVTGKNWNMDNIRLPQIKYLAKGGIVNMPSRGVPVGNAIAGERGQEGVIPLTDSQQMALLGEAIGKYITIHATIPVYAYNRQVDRQIVRIKAEDNFAGNR